MKEFFARLNPTERRFVVGVAVVFFIVINLVWVWPHFSDWGQTKVRMKTASDKLVLFQGGMNKVPGLQREIEKYQKQGAVVAGSEQAVQFVREIQSESARSGVIIVNMSPQRQTGTNAFFVEQNETVTLQSGEKQLVDFLYNLGSGKSMIRVKVLSVQPDQSHQQLTTRATLIASYQKPLSAGRSATAAPAAAAPTAPATFTKQPAPPSAKTNVGAPASPGKPPVATNQRPATANPPPVPPGVIKTLTPNKK